MDINFELYKIFYHAAREKSFSAAASRLFITQSAVSQAIKNLEERLGQRLFFRKSRSISLTQEGQVLYKHVEQAFNFIKTGENRLAEIKNLRCGEIRLGAGDTVFKHFLVPYLEKFIQVYPKIKFKVINRTSSLLISALKNGLLDLCVCTLPVAEPSVETAHFKYAEDIFVASPRYGCPEARRLPLSELCRSPLLMLPGESSTRRNIDEFFSKMGLTLTPEIELDSIDLLLELSRIGLGIAHVLKDSALPFIERGELTAVGTETDLPARELGVCTVKNVPLSPAAREFAGLLTA